MVLPASSSSTLSMSMGISIHTQLVVKCRDNVFMAISYLRSHHRHTGKLRNVQDDEERALHTWNCRPVLRSQQWFSFMAHSMPSFLWCGGDWGQTEHFSKWWKDQKFHSPNHFFVCFIADTTRKRFVFVNWFESATKKMIFSSFFAYTIHHQQSIRIDSGWWHFFCYDEVKVLCANWQLPSRNERKKMKQRMTIQSHHTRIISKMIKTIVTRLVHFCRFDAEKKYSNSLCHARLLHHNRMQMEMTNCVCAKAIQNDEQLISSRSSSPHTHTIPNIEWMNSINELCFVRKIVGGNWMCTKKVLIRSAANKRRTFKRICMLMKQTNRRTDADSPVTIMLFHGEYRPIDGYSAGHHTPSPT